jgi:hypothetical protein
MFFLIFNQKKKNLLFQNNDNTNNLCVYFYIIEIYIDNTKKYFLKIGACHSYQLCCSRFNIYNNLNSFLQGIKMVLPSEIYKNNIENGTKTCKG